MTTRPITTGRLPRSPPLIRDFAELSKPAMPAPCTSRCSVRSVGSGTAGPDSSAARRSVIGAILETLALSSLGHDVVRRSGDRGHDLLGAGLGHVELGSVAAEPENDDAVGHGLDVGHVVADQDD